MKNRIAQLREERGMTQVRLSIELGVSQETVSAYENGKHYPSVAMLLKMAELFGASCDYILGLSPCRTAETEASLSADEQQLLAHWRALSPAAQQKLQGYLDALRELS